MDDVDRIVEQNDFMNRTETISVNSEESKKEKYTILIGCMMTDKGWIDITSEEYK